MKPITSALELRNAIQQLEQEQKLEWISLKTQLDYTYAQIKPINFLRNTFKEMSAIPDLTANIVNTAIGFTTGIVAKKVFQGTSRNPLTKLLGIIVEIVTTSIVTKNADGIKEFGGIVFNKIGESFALAKQECNE